MHPVNYIFNVATAGVMLLVALFLNMALGSAEDRRDDSAMIWEGPCQVNPELRSGAVSLTCTADGEPFMVGSTHSEYVSLVGNTPLGERSAITAACQSYQSGRWMCTIGETIDPQRFGTFSTAEAE